MSSGWIRREARPAGVANDLEGNRGSNFAPIPQRWHYLKPFILNLKKRPIVRGEAALERNLAENSLARRDRRHTGLFRAVQVTAAATVRPRALVAFARLPTINFFQKGAPAGNPITGRLANYMRAGEQISSDFGWLKGISVLIKVL
jgi:transposase InsO family protein